MITTWEEYQKNYVDLLVNGVLPDGKKKMVNPETEPKFIINADTRTINIPRAFENGVAVYKDYKSETLFFEIDRFFDDVDFSSKSCCVQFINMEQQQFALPVTLKYLSEDGKKLIFGWTLPQEVTVKEGDVTFSIRFFSLNKDNVLNYNWSTRPATIKVYKGLYIVEGTETIPSKSTLEQLLNQIQEIWGNDAQKVSYNNLDPDSYPTIDSKPIKGEVGNLIREAVTGKDIGSFLTLDNVLQTLLPLNDSQGNYPVSSNAVQIKFNFTDIAISNLQDAIDEINSELGDMTFIPITIESFDIQLINVGNSTSGNTALVQNGTKVSNIKFTWILSKVPASLKIDNVIIPSFSTNGSYTNNLTTPITENKNFILEVADKKGEPVTTEAHLIFCDDIYWGVKGLVDSIDENFIKSLSNKKLVPESNVEISINIPDNQYLYIAIPTSLGNNFSFYFDGSALNGGMNLINENSDIIVTGINSYQTHYKVYRSTNSGLGQRTIRIE